MEEAVNPPDKIGYSLVPQDNHTADVDMITLDNAEPEPAYYLPINVVTRIFRLLDVDELEISRQVCKSWKSVIDTHRKSMRMREIDVLHLSSNCEYTFALYSGNKVYRYCCQKFYTAFDYECRSKEKLSILEPPNDTYKLPCGSPLLREVPSMYENIPGQGPDGRRHMSHCTIRYYSDRSGPANLCNCMIYNPTKRNLYARQMFCPPLFWYQKLEELTAFTNIQTLVFYHYSIIETTADMLKRWVGTFHVDKVVFHHINLRAVSKEEFHSLLTTSIVAREYHIMYVKKALPHHFNAELFSHKTMLEAQVVQIGTVLTRGDNPTWLKFGMGEEDFLNFVNWPVKRDSFKFCHRNFNFNLDTWRRILMNKKDFSFRNIGQIPQTEADLNMQNIEINVEEDDDAIDDDSD